MASLSGLSSSSSVSRSTATWAELNKRQCRVVSHASEVEKRIDALSAKLSSFGWVDPRGTPAPMIGADWSALADRQQALLRKICDVKERLKKLGFDIGFTNPAYEENKAQPQLMKRVPSHFNNAQLAEFLQRGWDADQAEPNRRIQATYPFTKLCVMVLVRDLQRFITSGCHRPMSFLLPAGAAAPTLTTAAATPDTEAHTEIMNRLAQDDADGTTFRFLLKRMLHLLCGIDLSPSDLSHVIDEGGRLLALSLQVDTDTREIFHAESYELGADNLVPSPAFTASLSAFRSKQARSWFTSGVSPFEHFQFTRPPKSLQQAKRQPCPKCYKPSSLYCPFCMVPTLPPEMQIPEVQLPLKVDIVHHVGENVKKSTSIHACILAPAHCRFLEHPEQLPPYDPNTTILLYPTSDAVYLDDDRIDLTGVERVIVIESTWSKSDVVASHPSLNHLRRVKIRDHESTFWRYQELGRNFLSTLEAIYYTCQEFQQRRNKHADQQQTHNQPSQPSIDDLLYFYAFQHSRITDRYTSGGREKAPRSWTGGEPL